VEPKFFDRINRIVGASPASDPEGLTRRLEDTKARTTEFKSGSRDFPNPIQPIQPQISQISQIEVCGRLGRGVSTSGSFRIFPVSGDMLALRRAREALPQIAAAFDACGIEAAPSSGSHGREEAG
jgi:hypothetical protein